MEKTFIFAGFGGQGMLLIGKFMAMACMLDGKHVSWLPSYGPEMRGGTANCSVIVSDDPVASPLVDKADVIVAMNRPSLDKFEEHVKPGGVLVINSSIIDRKAVRDDIQVVYCDANAIAESIGNPKGANVAILGAVLEKVPVTTVEQMTEAIRIELGERKARFLDGNKKALVPHRHQHDHCQADPACGADVPEIPDGKCVVVHAQIVQGHAAYHAQKPQHQVQHRPDPVGSPAHKEAYDQRQGAPEQRR